MPGSTVRARFFAGAERLGAFLVGANSFAKQEAVLPLALSGAAAPPLANEFAPTQEHSRLLASPS
ncbi:hypothetical protein D6Z43_17985 [Pseudomonas sp. DY-1]|nr:hypothetical protein D6Z43_17985 [Pseudomonas sp. DY-1]MDH4653125.1 hypothetical protein [Pseudomonas sp. BN606]